MSRRPSIVPAALTRQRLIGLLHAHARRVALVLFLQLAAALTSVALPWIVDDIIDGIRAGMDSAQMHRLLLLAVVFVIANFALAWWTETRTRIFGETVFARLRDGLVDSVVHLPLSTIETAGSGDLISRTTTDIDRVQMMIRQGLSTILILLMTIGMILSTTFVATPNLARILPIEIIGVVGVNLWYMPKTVSVYRASAAMVAVFSGHPSETITQTETVNALRFGVGRHRTFDSMLAQMWRLERHEAWIRGFPFLRMVVMTLVPIAAMILLGAILVPMGVLTTGSVTTLVMYCHQIHTPLWQATFWTGELQFAWISLQWIFGVELVEPDRRTNPQAQGDGPIRVEGVSYAYHEGRPVLHGIDLELHEGETLAIAGLSDVDRSALGHVIAGIHPPTSGRIRSEQTEFVKLPEEELHRRIVLAVQEHHVFVGTIADNVQLARVDISGEELWAALKLVGMDSWVQDEDGLGVRVGAGDTQLTPARTQQITLARITLMDPATLVLDEATSLLDPESARSVEDFLGGVLSGRAIVAIAHRLHTAQDAGRVAVMIKGSIVELGTREGLLTYGGKYATLWRAWQGE